MPGGAKTVKGAQSDPNYVSRLLLDCVPVFHKIITGPAYLLYTAYRMFAGGANNYSYATVLSECSYSVCELVSSRQAGLPHPRQLLQLMHNTAYLDLMTRSSF